MKKVTLLLAFVFAAFSMSAQESSAEAGYKTTFQDNGFWDNWFVGVGAAGNVYIGEGIKDAAFWRQVTVAPNLQVGKWYNPFIGGRLKLEGGSLHTRAGGPAMMHSKYAGAEVDFLFNFTNYICKYREDRVYNFIPFVGIGGAYNWDSQVHGVDLDGHRTAMTINAGFINNFRLSNRLNLAIEVSGAFLNDHYNRRDGGTAYDGKASASASLVYKLGKTGFQEAVLLDQGLIDDLNNQINRLRDENERLRNQKPNCPPVKECPPCPEATKDVFVSNVVFFRIGSANIDAKQNISIYNTAKYLQDNPDAKVRIVGYADKNTGTASFNMKLSEKRAKNVANALINKYNIDSNRVTVEWKGDTVQPYAENDWNRVAIFFAE